MLSELTIACRACGNLDGNVPLEVREMLFGSGEAFRYTECATCGSISINSVPDDLHRHYPEHYYSFAEPPKSAPTGHYRALGNRLRTYLLLLGVPGSARLLRRNRPPEWLQWLQGRGVTPASTICDIGCGEGSLLHSLRRAGFTNLTGADPFVKASSEWDGVKILKATIDEIDGRFDLVMLNHSFEHMAEPHQVLAGLRRLLAPGGLALIRTPVAGTYAWKTYGPAWSGLDAPRHLAVYTVAAMRAMASSADLVLQETVFDSNTFLCWGSEQYLRGLPGVHPFAKVWTPHEMFSAADLEAFERLVARLNAANDGDQACFYLRAA